MGALIAVLNKKGENASEAAVDMLKTLRRKSVETYGIASPCMTRIEDSVEKLQSQKIDSPVIVGYAFSRILKQDRPQPLKMEDASMAFDGRTFPAKEQIWDAEASVLRLLGNREENAKIFVRKTEGDFAFAIAEAERLIAGRDALGVRPLYYGENSFFVGLASERKALWRIGIENTNSFNPGHVASIDKRGFRFSLARRLTYSKPKQITMKVASDKLQTLLKHAVRERVSDLKEVAVAFSGGIDSSIIAFLARKSGVNVELLHVSLDNQPETEHAERMAEVLKLPISSYMYTEDDVLKTLPMVLRLIEEPDPVKVTIGIPVYWTAEKSAMMQLETMLAGQGGDELFAGYRRYTDIYLRDGSEVVHEAIFRDVVGMYKNNFERDLKICNFHGVELRLPFVAYKIADFAVNLPVELKLQPSSSSLRKLVLRKAARDFGLPPEIVDRPKRAVQYATGVSAAVEKIVKREHLSLREYLNATFQTALKRMKLGD